MTARILYRSGEPRTREVLSRDELNACRVSRWSENRALILGGRDCNYFSPVILHLFFSLPLSLSLSISLWCRSSRNWVADESASSVVSSSDRLRVHVKTTRQSQTLPDRIETRDSLAWIRYRYGAARRATRLESIIQEDPYCLGARVFKYLDSRSAILFKNDVTKSAHDISCINNCG